VGGCCSKSGEQTFCNDFHLNERQTRVLPALNQVARQTLEGEGPLHITHGCQREIEGLPRRRKEPSTSGRRIHPSKYAGAQLHGPIRKYFAQHGSAIQLRGHMLGSDQEWSKRKLRQQLGEHTFALCDLIQLDEARRLIDRVWRRRINQEPQAIDAVARHLMQLLLTNFKL